MIDFYKVVSQLFDHFYNKIYRTQFHLDLEINNHRKVIDSFIKLLKKEYDLSSIGNNYLIEFFSFSFSYWSTKKTKRKITLNWIIGKKTFKRWLERKEGTDHYTSKFIKEYDIDVDRLRQELQAKPHLDQQQLSTSEEVEKLRFQGDARLYNCLQTTTLYNHRSINCLSCCNKTVCKTLLKNTRPNLYIQRGYEKLTEV